MTNGKLYKVELLDSEILHMGDMALTDQAYLAIEDVEAMKKYAQSYWNGVHTEKPVLECLTTKAAISEIISKDEQERKAYLRQRVIISSSDEDEITLPDY